MYTVQNLGLNMPGQQKAQGYFNSVGTSLGQWGHESLGMKRHEPDDFMPIEVPCPTTYNIRKTASENSNPTWKFGSNGRSDPKRNDWPGPADTNVPIQPTNEKAFTNGRATRFPINDCPKPGQKLVKREEQGDDGLGPGAYQVKIPNNVPIYSFGTRFNSSIRNKDHLRPTKVDGPGPGAYKLPSGIKTGKQSSNREILLTHMLKNKDKLIENPDQLNKRYQETTKTTFGRAGRKFIDLAQDNPGPGAHRPQHFTEASHCFSIPKAVDNYENELNKAMFLPGPDKYNNMQEMYKQDKYAKSILGGTLKKTGEADKDNGNPSPDAYHIPPQHSIPGFVIKPDTQSNNKKDESGKPAVGPQRYNPQNPNHHHSDYLNLAPGITSIGKAQLQTKKVIYDKDGKFVREITPDKFRGMDLVQAANVPGPGKYDIIGLGDKVLEKPKFHMGIKTQSFAGKNMDMPGPGEYETDVIPIHHSNVAHFIGTSVRSDLGVGKAYMYPGPGEYEAQVDAQMDPRIRIAGTFGTDKKDTVIKKTFAPGPGSYDLPASVGLMPQYLRSEENRAIKQAQEDALRARLEI